MTARHLLSAVFRAALPPGTDAAVVPADTELEPLLAGLLASGRASWPDVDVDASTFVTYLAKRAEPARISAVKGDDLYIACACVQGSTRGLAAIESRYMSELDGALARMKLAPGTIDDVKQNLRRQLFVGEPGTAPRIAEYTGRGELRGWLRVTATRAALKVLRKDKREVPVDDDALLERGATGDDPELSYVKQVYRAQFKAAFQQALDSLDDREKNLLRQTVVDGLGIDELCVMYGVHRATVARWVQKARETLLDRTRRNFMANARVNKQECESIMRLVHSQLDGTIRRRIIEG